MSELRAKLLGPDGVRDIPVDQIDVCPPPGQLLWVDCTSPDEATLTKMSGAHGFHDLVAADVLSLEGRPRVERYEDHLLMVMKALNLNPERDPLEVISVYILVFQDRIFTFHAEPVQSIEEAWRSAQLGTEDGTATTVLHSILTRILLRYLEATEEIEDALEELQPHLEGNLDPSLPRRLYEWRVHLNGFRRRTRPHREMLLNLTTLKHPALPESLRPYLRDALDLVLRLDDRITSHRDLIQGAGEVYMAGAAQETNEVMKVLSLVATVVLPLNILTGLYGTNFATLPGSQVDGAFWVFLAALVGLGGLTAGLFRLRGWL